MAKVKFPLRLTVEQSDAELYHVTSPDYRELFLSGVTPDDALSGAVEILEACLGLDATKGQRENMRVRSIKMARDVVLNAMKNPRKMCEGTECACAGLCLQHAISQLDWLVQQAGLNTTKDQPRT